MAPKRSRAAGKRKAKAAKAAAAPPKEADDSAASEAAPDSPGPVDETDALVDAIAAQPVEQPDPDQDPQPKKTRKPSRNSTDPRVDRIIKLKLAAYDETELATASSKTDGLSVREYIAKEVRSVRNSKQHLSTKFWTDFFTEFSLGSARFATMVRQTTGRTRQLTTPSWSRYCKPMLRIQPNASATSS